MIADGDLFIVICYFVISYTVVPPLFSMDNSLSYEDSSSGNSSLGGSDGSFSALGSPDLARSSEARLPLTSANIRAMEKSRYGGTVRPRSSGSTSSVCDRILSRRESNSSNSSVSTNYLLGSPTGSQQYSESFFSPSSHNHSNNSSFGDVRRHSASSVGSYSSLLSPKGRGCNEYGDTSSILRRQSSNTSKGLRRQSSNTTKGSEDDEFEDVEVLLAEGQDTHLVDLLLGKSIRVNGHMRNSTMSSLTHLSSCGTTLMKESGARELNSLDSWEARSLLKGESLGTGKISTQQKSPQPSALKLPQIPKAQADNMKALQDALTKRIELNELLHVNNAP